MEAKEKLAIEFDNQKFPEGGFGWFVVAGAWCAMAATFGMMNSFAVYQAYYQSYLYPTEGAYKLGLIGALQSFFMYMFSIPAVFMLQKLGARLSLAIGSLIQVFSLMILSLTGEVWQLFLVQGLLFGIGSGILYIIALTILVQWFKTRKALASGIASSGSSIGGVIWPIVVRKLIDKVGIHWTNRILGFTYIPLGIIIVVLLRPRLSIKGVKQIEEPHFSHYDSFKDPKFVLLVISSFVTNLALFPGLFYIDLYGQRLQIKLGETLVAHDSLVSILNAASVVGRIVPGLLADKFGRLNVLIPFIITSGILPLAMWLNSSHSERVLIAYTVLWGLSSGAMISGYPVLIPQIFGVHNNHRRLGVFTTLGGVGGLFGPIICGSFIPSSGPTVGVDGFDKVAIFIGVTMISGALFLLGVRLLISRKLKVIL